ncbi:hypothetical protein AWW66_15325 [Micromonospora rosaria]|uniref:Uncharacterized protein n=1 Tax=Micromonospora rosaria TaxID=47874 RepID=A0A136PSD9_9ACTN|nr:hypothetical protein [Micromonospora rosaria]KXK61076.1 hypothetical protein AWW66_15325 [Micromonospora rosaria]
MDPLLTLAITVAAPAALVTLGYAGLCYVRPFTRCRRCAGTGQTTTRFLRRPRACRRCDRGIHLRVGRRIFAYFHRIRSEATR